MKILKSFTFAYLNSVHDNAGPIEIKLFEDLISVVYYLNHEFE